MKYAASRHTRVSDATRSVPDKIKLRMHSLTELRKDSRRGSVIRKSPLLSLEAERVPRRHKLLATMSTRE